MIGIISFLESRSSPHLGKGLIRSAADESTIATRLFVNPQTGGRASDPRSGRRSHSDCQFWGDQTEPKGITGMSPADMPSPLTLPT
jgi:hypothetical protein